MTDSNPSLRVCDSSDFENYPDANDSMINRVIRRTDGTGETRQTRKPASPGHTQRQAGATARPLTWWHALLDAAGSGPTGKQAGARQCPAHDDAHPSLSIGEGDDGRLLLRCHAGCDWRAVVTALSCRPAYLFQPPPVDAAAYAAAFITGLTFPPLSARRGRSPQSRGYRLDAIHDYGDQHRVLRYRKGTSKQMHWETKRGNCWEPGLYGTPTSSLPLYREPDIRMAIAAGEPVLLVESESSVDALRGHYGTTWAGGAASPQIDRLRRVLGGYLHVIVIPDADPAGIACLGVLSDAGLAPNVVMPEPGEDARDLLTRLGENAFRALLAVRPMR